MSIIIEGVLQGFDVCSMKFLLLSVSNLHNLENCTPHGSSKISAGGRILGESSGRGAAKNHIGGAGEKGIGISLQKQEEVTL